MRTLLVLLLCLAQPALALTPGDCRRVAVVGGDGGEALSGIEDLVYHPPSGDLILSVHDRWGDGDDEAAVKGLFAVALDDLAFAGQVTASRIGPETEDGLPLRPHGIALRDFGDGDWRLAVVNHRVLQQEDTADGRAGTVIEEYSVAPDGTLTRGRTVTGPLCPANDLDWLDRDRLVVTLDRTYCGGARRFVELSLGLWWGRLVEADLSTGGVRTLAEDLGFPNGVLVQDDEVFVAFSREKRIARYRRDAVGRLDEIRHAALSGGGDNLSADAAGRLLLAVHPDLTEFGLYSLRVWGYDSAPTRLVRVAPRNLEIETLLDDPDGVTIAGATSVIEAGGHWIAGAAFDSGLLVCPAHE